MRFCDLMGRPPTAVEADAATMPRSLCGQPLRPLAVVEALPRRSSGAGRSRGGQPPMSKPTLGALGAGVDGGGGSASRGVRCYRANLEASTESKSGSRCVDLLPMCYPEGTRAQPFQARPLFLLAQRAGLEPATRWLTATNDIGFCNPQFS